MNNEEVRKEAADRREGIERLYGIIARLRAPDGCPWDRVQTAETLKPCLIEECYELLDVMAGDDRAGQIEELGDVLLQVLFQAHLHESKGDFTLVDVLNGISDKLVRRHPHVFGDVVAKDVSQVLTNWEQIKKGEKKGKDGAPRSALAGVPPSLPSLLRAQRVQTKSARVGFAWPDIEGAKAKVAEEMGEVAEAKEAGDKEAVSREMGDLLFSLVNCCRYLEVDAETSLREAVDRFSDRFRAVEKEARAEGRDMRDCSPEELQAFWEKVKKEES